jgi:hypothetical protein
MSSLTFDRSIPIFIVTDAFYQLPFHDDKSDLHRDKVRHELAFETMNSNSVIKRCDMLRKNYACEAPV